MLKELQERMKSANKIIRSKRLADVQKVDELVAMGFKEEDAIKLMEIRGWWGTGFAPFELSNNNARIKDAEQRLKRHEQMAGRKDEEHEHEWGTLQVCYSDERYRFVFNERPSDEVISLMKEHAFKWSRSNQAWQRQITGNAAYTIMHYILPKLKELYETAK